MEEKKIFAHETALIDEGCDIGGGTKIWPLFPRNAQL